MNASARQDALDALATQDALTGLDFTGVDLRTALARRGSRLVLRDCVISRADLRDADLTGATFENCTAVGADLSRAVLAEARFVGGSFATADFREADLGDAAFTDTDLANACLSRAMLDDVTFTGCRMTGADLSALQGLAVTLTFSGCSMQLVDLHGTALRGIRVSRCDLTEANLARTDLRDAVFEDCRLREVHFQDTRLSGADLRGADLGEITERVIPLLRGAIISPEQAADVCSALGLQVAETIARGVG
ncbi:pentapeptide repeat-containing protein [Streptomyces sp. NPDC003077]|uniref:pentapeptide repeat-containing protein n=1 Tax=Streptomyces sp. NPDC003077 TaxID=3154443 RepID=UPI0033BCF3BF